LPSVQADMHVTGKPHLAPLLDLLVLDAVAHAPEVLAALVAPQQLPQPLALQPHHQAARQSLRHRRLWRSAIAAIAAPAASRDCGHEAERGRERRLDLVPEPAPEALRAGVDIATGIRMSERVSE